jgi:hypothetical protein
MIGWFRGSSPFVSIGVTDRDLTMDLDLGLLGRFIPATKARDAISNRVRGLLT